MEKIIITENLIQYQFPPCPQQHFGYNVFAVFDGKRALLIDTGYQEHAALVHEDLSANGIAPEKVIISHFHDDHFDGLRVFQNLQVFGSKSHQITLDLYTPEEDHKLFKPTDIVTDETTFQYGDFHIRFHVIPGHAICGLYTIINDKYIHIGDDIVQSNEDFPLLPTTESHRIPEFINALETLKMYKNHTLLLAHGNPMTGESNILNAITNSQSYLKTVNQSPTRIPYEKAVEECSCDFLHKEWHEFFYE
ncbi:MAG: MBL fold metallo-hydrolase [Anaerolineaceae bacterium]|nr:MBL fold metallo-hydrolase [Anaerolineaceae bacterium]